MIKLMFDNIQVAHIEGSLGNYHLSLEEGIPKFFIPQNLFKGDNKSIPNLTFIAWISKRIFPKERVGCEELIKELDISEYRAFAIAEKTKACLMEDGWWVAFNEEDNFREHTIRGAAGFPEWEIVEGKPVLKKGGNQ